MRTKLFLGALIFLLMASCKSSGDHKETEYRDLNKNGSKDVYEDPARPVDERVEDLLDQMNLEEKAGLLFNAIAQIEQGGGLGMIDSLITQVNITHMGMPELPTAKQLLEHNNAVQKIAEETRLGIPVTFYSDPRNGVNQYFPTVDLQKQ